jgi:hypothetical protein
MSHDEARAAHLARAASVGLAALPASRRPGSLAPAPERRHGRWSRRLCAPRDARLGLRARAAPVRLRSLRCDRRRARVAAAAGAAAWRGREAAPPAALARDVGDVDASVPLGPGPGCAPEGASVETLGAGARPAVSDGGSVVWYDAAGEDGRRQIQRLDRRSGVSQCWTCAEPGSNRRPRRRTAPVVRDGSSREARAGELGAPLPPRAATRPPPRAG